MQKKWNIQFPMRYGLVEEKQRDKRTITNKQFIIIVFAKDKTFLWPFIWFFSARFIKMMNLSALTWSTIILSKFTAYIHRCRNKRFTLTYDFPVENKIFSSEKQHRKYFLYWTMIWKSPLSVYAFLIENSQSNFFPILF